MFVACFILAVKEIRAAIDGGEIGVPLSANEQTHSQYILGARRVWAVVLKHAVLPARELIKPDAMSCEGGCKNAVPHLRRNNVNF